VIVAVCVPIAALFAVYREITPVVVFIFNSTPLRAVTETLVGALMIA
jgi:hypothetical protein